jgi:hypothetical protein
MTDNWMELAMPLLADDHGVHDLRDVMTRDILAAMDAAGRARQIELAQDALSRREGVPGRGERFQFAVDGGQEAHRR